MSDITPAHLATTLPTGLLSFPVTHFDADLAFDEPAYRRHLAWLAEYEVAGLFAAGGTGEGFSLTQAETSRVIRAAVSELSGRVPVLAPAMGATATAVAQATDAQAAGADGILLFPPYLTEAGQDGLADHVSAVCASTGLGVIVYNRANAVLNDHTLARLAEGHENLIGVKDGYGSVELMARIYAKLGDRLMYIGGLPTAETFALPYLEMGVSTYSSALFNFVPEFALGFYADVRARDAASVYAKLRDFVIPYLDIRDRAKGYAVSIVKAGLVSVGRDPGRVRPPLRPLTADDQAELSALVATIT